MARYGPTEGGLSAVLERLRTQAAPENVRITRHASEEMVEEDIALDEVLEAVQSGQILEDYPQHRRGPCCLIAGVTRAGRPIHVVCTTAQPVLIIITVYKTVYKPRPPKWVTATQRGPSR